MKLKLAKFVEDIIVPPRMIDVIVDVEVLSKKLKFVATDSFVSTSMVLKDVQPELERLRQKAISKVFEFTVQKLYALRKPKTNIQILQQSVLMKYKYVISFMKEHGKEVYSKVRAAYIDTMNKVLSAHFRAYIQSLEKLQLDIATSSDLIGVEARSSRLFSTRREPLKNRSSVFALGDRINILKEIDQPALIPHIAEASSQKYPCEVLFRSLQKLLMDTSSSEYLFCGDFFGEESLFNEIFAGICFAFGFGTKSKERGGDHFFAIAFEWTISVLKEAGPDGGKIQMHFEDVFKSQTSIFVEELLLEHFSDLIKFVKTRASEDPSSSSEKAITVGDVEPLVKDFGTKM